MGYISPRMGITAKSPVYPKARRYPRYRCQLPVQMELPGCSFPTQGQGTDLNLGGLYVNSYHAIPVGTEVSVKVWISGKSIRSRAIVRSADPGVGNGLELLNPDEASLTILRNFFSHLEAAAKQGASVNYDDIKSLLVP